MEDSTLQNAVSAFDVSRVKIEEVDVEKIHAKIGQLTLENDFLERRSGASAAERKAMIDRDHDLSLTRQADLLELSRGSLYYVPIRTIEGRLELMRPRWIAFIRTIRSWAQESCATNSENSAIVSAAGTSRD